MYLHFKIFIGVKILITKKTINEDVSATAEEYFIWSKTHSENKKNYSDKFNLMNDEI